MSSEQRLIADLRAAGIAFAVREHEAVFSVEESAGLHAKIAGAHPPAFPNGVNKGSR